MRTMLTMVLLAGALAATAVGDDRDFQWQGKLGPGQTMEIRGVLGSIHAASSPDGTASVTAHRTGMASDPSAVSVQVVPYDGGVVICAIYPGSRKPNMCNPPGGDIYVSADEGNDVQVEFTLQVPQGVRLDAATVKGDIEATSLTADVNASTIEGKITISTTGAAQASTLRGSITAVTGSVNWNGTRMFSSGEGDVDLQIPADAKVSVQASAFHGSIISDFPLTITTTPIGLFSMGQGKLGMGGRALRLSAFDGNVRLRQGPASGQ